MITKHENLSLKPSNSVCVYVYIKDLSLVSHSNFVERKKKTAVDNRDRGRASPSNPKVREQSLNS